MNPETKEKWEKLKKGTGQVIEISKDFYSKYLSPVVAVGVGYGKEVINKIESSENPNIKYAKGNCSVIQN